MYNKPVLLQMFKTIRGNAPAYLRNSFPFATDIHARLLRSSSSFQKYTPKPHLDIYRNTFVFYGSPVWNSLPSYLQNSNSIQHFKCQYLRWINTKPSHTLIIIYTLTNNDTILVHFTYVVVLRYSNIDLYVNKNSYWVGIRFLP